MPSGERPTSLVIAQDSGKGLLKNTSGEKEQEPDLFRQSRSQGGIAYVVPFRQSVQRRVFSLILDIYNTCRNSFTCRFLVPSQIFLLRFEGDLGKCIFTSILPYDSFLPQPCDSDGSCLRNTIKEQRVWNVNTAQDLERLFLTFKKVFSSMRTASP